MADFDAKKLEDSDGNGLNLTPTHFLDAQGGKHSIEVEFGKKQNTISTEDDNSDIADNTVLAKTLANNKLKTTLAVRLWNYIKGKLGFNSTSGKFGINISGSAGSAEKLGVSAGGESQPVYFSSSGIPTVIPLAEIPQNSGNHYLTMQVQGAYYAATAGRAAEADRASGAGRLNLSAAVGSGNQPVYFTDNGVPAVIPTQQVTIGGQQVPVLTLAVRTAYAAEQANSAATATGANKLNLNAAVGSGNQPVYFTDNGVPAVIPTQQVSIGGQQVSVLTLAVHTAFASEKSTKDSDGSQINTTYLKKTEAEMTYSRIVNVRSIENHTYNLSGENTDVTAFEINFAGYDSLPKGRPTMLLISLQYECAGGTALGLKFKYGGTSLGATSLPDGRHHVTLPVVWQARHDVLAQNPFSLCFSGVNGASVHVMSGSLILM